MGRFKVGIQKSQTVEENSAFDGEPEDQKTNTPERNKTRKPENQYSDEEMKLVNVGGFKVPRVVRDHWAIGAKRAHTPISRMFRELLIEKFGLPDGISEKDL